MIPHLHTIALLYINLKGIKQEKERKLPIDLLRCRHKIEPRALASHPQTLNPSPTCPVVGPISASLLSKKKKKLLNNLNEIKFKVTKATTTHTLLFHSTEALDLFLFCLESNENTRRVKYLHASKNYG